MIAALNHAVINAQPVESVMRALKCVRRNPAWPALPRTRVRHAATNLAAVHKMLLIASAQRGKGAT